jgi:regulator of replication initiation timing
MASFEPSYTALKNLRQKIYDATTTTVTLPLRPENPADLHPYLDSTIVTLSTSTAYLYDDNAPWAVRVVEVKKGVERVDAKLDEAKTTLQGQIKEVKTQVEDVKTQVEDVKTQMKSLEKRLTGQVDDVRATLRNHTAIQLNSLRKWLGDPIEPVSALALDEGSLKYTIAEGFPTRVKDF